MLLGADAFQSFLATLRVRPPIELFHRCAARACYEVLPATSLIPTQSRCVPFVSFTPIISLRLDHAAPITNLAKIFFLFISCQFSNMWQWYQQRYEPGKHPRVSIASETRFSRPKSSKRLHWLRPNQPSYGNRCQSVIHKRNDEGKVVTEWPVCEVP